MGIARRRQQPLVVFSNCEEIEVLIGEQSQGRFKPDIAQYPHLPHPPFVVRWPEPYNPWRTAFCDLTVRGFINGQVIAEHKIASDHIPERLDLRTHTARLQPDGADMARMSVQIVDRYGNVLPYQSRIVEFSLEGDAELIGENPLPLLGGQGVCYVKSGHAESALIVHARTAGLAPVSVTLQVSDS
jgi:beta-galactosidase